MKPNPKKKEAPAPDNSFLSAFAELRNGAALNEASDGLAQVVKEVRKTGKSGELTIKMKVTGDDGESMSIRCEVVPKVPKKETRATSFYDAEDGSIQRDNPRQVQLFNPVDGGQAEEPTPEAQPLAVNG